MEVEVIEFELVCACHGVHKVLVPAAMPRPQYCAHCFDPVTRRELRRFTMDRPLPVPGPEAFIG